ncbi:uncharacterized protein SAPINGB_P005274 [Magnusiomyces paraingens]|uniref:Uncharacterized protein n=1 Tax=Magnusiomyces paraingens TaxID=2606893 RepID=A0A5E8BZ78_9ASCO|nr:uncharacterized protein SAPINGB_P005274 [Saprochaete ingens]VVT56787.1 unnamed protein product [Saprochaete ingens]
MLKVELCSSFKFYTCFVIFILGSTGMLSAMGIFVALLVCWQQWEYSRLYWYAVSFGKYWGSTGMLSVLENIGALLVCCQFWKISGLYWYAVSFGKYRGSTGMLSVLENIGALLKY